MPVFFNQAPINTESVQRYARRLANSGHALASDFHKGDVSLLGQGYNNQLFEIENDRGSHIVKIYPVGQVNRLIRESAVLRILKPIGAMPEVLLAEPYAKELGAPVLVYRKLQGQSVQAETLDRNDLIQLQELWQRIQRTPIPAEPVIRATVGPAMPEDCIRHIERMIQAVVRSETGNKLLLKETIEQLISLFHDVGQLDRQPRLWQDTPQRLCQADCRPANVLKDEAGHIRLIDWEHAGLMDPVYEVAAFFWHPETLALPVEERAYGMRLYCEHSQDKFAFEKMQVYQTILPVQWAAHILKLIHEYDEQRVQPWVTLRPVEDLWTDVTTYLEIARQMVGEALS